MAERILEASHPATAIGSVVAALLVSGGHAAPVRRDESLFLSGKLDSLAAAELLGTLEQDFGINVSDLDFDVREIDTVERIEALVRRASA